MNELKPRIALALIHILGHHLEGNLSCNLVLHQIIINDNLG